MASIMNDKLTMRTEFGTVNYYDNQKSIGTAAEKAWASRSGGHSFDLISHKPTHIFRHLRNSETCDSKPNIEILPC